MRIKKIYNKSCDFLEAILNTTTVLLVASLIIFVSIQVGSRAIGNSLLWTVDMSLFSLMWSTLIGAGLCVRHSEHFVINIWPENWEKFPLFLTFISECMIFFMGIFILIEGWKYAIDGSEYSLSMVNLPKSYLRFSIPFGGFLFILFSLEKILNFVIPSKEVEN